MTDVAIVGGGIAGLATAAALKARDRGLDVVVLERGDRVGGNIRSERVDGYLCEWGANGFLDSAPATLALACDLGLGREIVAANPAARRRFIYRGGVLHPLPGGPVEFLRSGLLSARAKLRLLAEPFAATRPEGDETIHAFAARRIGGDAADALIDPMVSGIFAGDARRLSLRASFPKMWDMETTYGGLFRAIIAKQLEKRRGWARRDGATTVGAPAGTLTSFRGGMETLVAALARRLGPIVRTGRPVQSIRRTPDGGGFRIHLAYTEPIDVGAVVLAGASLDAALIVGGLDDTLTSLLRAIPSAPLAVVCLGYDEAAVATDRGPLDGFGLLVPRGEGVRALGVLWDSSIFPNRAPEGRVLLRAMIGGAHDPWAVDLDDEILVDVVSSNLRTTMRLHARPSFVRVIRHRRGIPQYVVGHLNRLAAIDARLTRLPGLFLTGNSYRGIAINACIADAAATAEAVLQHVREAAREPALV